MLYYLGIPKKFIPPKWHFCDGVFKYLISKINIQLITVFWVDSCMSFNYHQNQDTEHFYHLPKFPCYP